MDLKELTVRTLGLPFAARIVTGCTSRSLRVVAYHGVTDPDSFDQHLTWICAQFDVLSGREVVDLVRRCQPFPKRAVWITFDDGLASVIREGLPVLTSHGAPATMFVSPGLTEDSALPWWTEITVAVGNGWVPPNDTTADQVVRSLKAVPDDVRREIVSQARTANAHHGWPQHDPIDAAAQRGELARWLASGRELGNHTWDHPCLDQCSPEMQTQQIIDADTWLREFGAFEDVRLFAYPNGDWTPEADAVLRSERYDIGLLFDHRVAGWGADPLRMSRLRLDSAAPIERARAVISGSHSAFLGERARSKAI